MPFDVQFFIFFPQIIKNHLKIIHLCPPPYLTQKNVLFLNLIFSFSRFYLSIQNNTKTFYGKRFFLISKEMFSFECFPLDVFILSYTIFSSSGLTFLLDVYVYTWYLYKMDNLLTIENIFLKQYLCLCGKHLIIFQSLGPRSAIKSVSTTFSSRGILVKCKS